MIWMDEVSQIVGEFLSTTVAAHQRRCCVQHGVKSHVEIVCDCSQHWNYDKCWCEKCGRTQVEFAYTRGIMKALTISQPFAFLIASGVKYIENRRWSTNYRGALAIHAGKGTQYLNKDELKEYATGAVVAVAKLAACVTLKVIQAKANSREQGDCIPGSKITWKEASIHPHAEGPWCWILEDVREIEHVKMNGAQGLWEVTIPQVFRVGR